jgi:hypothetical protein
MMYKVLGTNLPGHNSSPGLIVNNDNRTRDDSEPAIVSTHSLYFDGLNDYAVTEDVGILSPSDNLVVCAWFNFRSLGTVQTLFSQEGADGVDWLRVTTDGKLQSLIGGTLTGVKTLVVDRWYLLGFTKNGNQLSLFVDGTLEITATRVGVFVEENIRIGVDKSGSNFFSGMVDDIWIYNSNGSSNEMTVIFNNVSTSPPSITNLIYYWPCEEGIGTTTGSDGDEPTNLLLNGVTWSTEVPSRLN